VTSTPEPTTPRVVATDLDGTLLRSDGSVSAETRAALALARRAGATVVLVTARPVRWMTGVLEELGLVEFDGTTSAATPWRTESAMVRGELPHPRHTLADDLVADRATLLTGPASAAESARRATRSSGTVICANGALVYDVGRRAIETAHAFEPAALRRLAGRLRAAFPAVVFAAESPDGLGHEPTWPAAPYDPPASDPGRLVGPLDVLLDRPVVKLLARDVAADCDELFARALPVVAGDGELSFSGGNGLLEIGPPGVTKASTLAAWCRRAGLGAESVLAFGDMPNDLPMLAWAGRSCAVANAHSRVLAAADVVTASNDEDGVALMLRHVFGTPHQAS
jgi:hydroxymethylpyrimidine pyrophosphatase-like HAD family hydrolase